MIFNDWLGRRRQFTPDRVAIVDDASGQHYTYSGLDTRATRFAAILQGSLGIQPGDRVACLSTNRIEYIDLYFACGKIGAVLVPLNVRLPAAGMTDLLEDCQPRLLVYESEFRQIASFASQAKLVPCLLPIDLHDLGSDSEGNRTRRTGGRAGGQTIDAGVKVVEADEQDVAMILYTSGTTGRAKGAMISWRQIHWNALNTILGLQLSPRDVAFMNMPLYHTGGWHVLFTPLMLLGGRVVLQKRFEPERCNQRVGPEGVTILFAVPTMLRMMAEAPGFPAADLSRLRFAICGGEPCPLPLIETYQQRGVAMRQGYGLTEAGPNCFSLPAEDAIRKQGSIGFPNFHVGTRLAREDGGDAGVGEVGELLMKGPHLFAGYWNNQPETDLALRADWLHTGDLMTRDEEGYYSIVGRKKEMYVSGGENVYPAQVERVLQQHPAVALAAVVATPHPKWGEAGWAFVKLVQDCPVTEPDLRAWCRLHLAGYQCPAKVVVMEDLPVGYSGKIDKKALQQRATELSATP